MFSSWKKTYGVMGKGQESFSNYLNDSHVEEGKDSQFF